MAYQHGRSTVVSVAAKDLSAYTNTSQLNRKADVHDTTCYGVDDKTKQGGLRENTFTMGGIYDSTIATSPRGVFVGAVGSTLAIVRKPEGTGSGKPNEAFSGVLNSYVETNPVADMVSWQADFDISGPVTTTTQAP
jgi:hypothetical protein